MILDFPRTLDERVYHLGIKAGEVANRVVRHFVPPQIVITNGPNTHAQITVGSPSRARRIATYLDGSPKTFELSTERGFLTFTGRYKGVPVSIISIGMGSPNMDFFVREVRECLNGDLVIVRLTESPFISQSILTLVEISMQDLDLAARSSTLGLVRL